jgi:hypothetical protein
MPEESGFCQPIVIARMGHQPIAAKNDRLCGTLPGFRQVETWQSELDRPGSKAV